MTSTELAERFRDLRVRAGLTKTALARPKYTVSYVSQIEAGRRTPSAEAMEFFAQRLGVSPEFLTTGVPERTDDRLRFRLEESRIAVREGRLDEAAAAAQEVLGEATRFGLDRVRYRALATLGEVEASAGNLRQAVDTLEEALEGELSERERGMAVSRLARSYRSLGDLTYAKEIVERFLDAPGRPPLDPGLAAELHAVLISIYYERGDMTLAQRAAERAIAAAQQDVPLEIRANAYWDAGRILAETRRWDEALEYVTRARVLMEELDERRSVGDLLCNCAFICLEAEPPRTSEAADYLDRAEAVLRKVGEPRELGFVTSERARLALLEERYEDAVDLAERAIGQVAPDRLEAARCLFLKGRSLAMLGRIDDARSSLTEAESLFAHEGARQQQAACFRELGELYLAEGNVDAAIGALRAGLEALDPRRSRT